MKLELNSKLGKIRRHLIEIWYLRLKNAPYYWCLYIFLTIANENVFSTR